MSVKSIRAQRRGFSLLELLITLAAIAILLGLGFPLLNQFLAQRRLDEAAIALSNSLRRASDQAITQSQTVTVTLNSDTLSWQGENGQMLGERTLPGGAQLSPTGTITFSGRGLPVIGHDLSVSAASQSKAVYLLPTGAVIIR